MADVKKILFPVDLADPFPLAAEYAGLLARKSGAGISVLYVLPSLSSFPGLPAAPDREEKFARLRASILDGARRSMDRFVKERFHGVNAAGEVAAGDVAGEILACAERGHADVIVMGTRGRTGFNAVLFGSVASKVVKGAQCPVMTIRPSDEEL